MVRWRRWCRGMLNRLILQIGATVIGPTSHCPQGIELILLDLDNTILVDGSHVTPRVQSAIQLARQHGCMACVSSGRAYHMVPETLRSPEAMDYLLCSNGARVYDTIGGVLFEQLMAREQVLGAIDALKPLDGGWNAFIGDHSYFEFKGMSYMLTGHLEPMGSARPTSKLHSAAALNTKTLAINLRRGMRFAKRLVVRREGMVQVRSIRPYVEAAEEGIPKIGCSFKEERACERAIAILDHLGCFEVVRVAASELEITAKGVTKGTTATKLMEYLKVSPERAVAFGDSANDLSLADVCGVFVAMDNSSQRVKDCADDVCESVYDDGVARWLERAMAEAGEASYV